LGRISSLSLDLLLPLPHLFTICYHCYLSVATLPYLVLHLSRLVLSQSHILMSKSCYLCSNFCYLCPTCCYLHATCYYLCATCCCLGPLSMRLCPPWGCVPQGKTARCGLGPQAAAPHPGPASCHTSPASPLFSWPCHGNTRMF
jgi:hypothetical protein